MHDINLHRPAKFWESKDNNIRCYLCPHQCILSEGQSGQCLVRKVIDGQLVSTVYALPSALRVDPIEKKPLYHFLPGTRSYSVGTQGCNLKCKFCQNWHLSTRHGQATVEVRPEEVVFSAIEAECQSIALTYNEPIVFAEYAMDIRDKAQEADLPCVYITNGYITPEAREEVFKNIAAVNIDLKAFDDDIYQRFTGGKIKPVLDTIRWCVDEGIHTEITTLIVPGLNDSPEMIKRECQWLVKHCGEDMAFHVNAFHPDHKMLDYPRTSRTCLQDCKKIAEESGLKYVYVGNYPGFDNNTYCPLCHEELVQRNGYDIKGNSTHVHKSPIIWSMS
jgi:pyruvate formate lyase activating enzyme